MEPPATRRRQRAVKPNRPLLAGTAALAVALGLAACGAAGSNAPGTAPGASVIPRSSIAPGTSLGEADLRIRLIDALGPPWYCDPDLYPLARPSFDEQATAIERFADMQAEGEVFGAVVRHLGLAGTTSFTDAQKLAIYQLWKQATAVSLTPATDGRFRFDYAAAPVEGSQIGVETSGTVDAAGTITVTSTGTAAPPNCPICLARGTQIDTPMGPVAVERLGIGQAVWTIDGFGGRVRALVLALGSTIAPATHRVIHLLLADGRNVTASPGHPLADGRTLESLRIGDLVDGSRVMGLDSLPYGSGRTYDLVVSGPTGIYLAGGIPLRSTLR